MKFIDRITHNLKSHTMGCANKVHASYISRSMNGQGYTIVETLIFLAVTGSLFVSTITVVSGQQAKTEFAQAIRDVQSQMQDVANDVSTGYYHNTAQFKCQAGPTGPNITNFGGGDTQGVNEDCIFIGRAIQIAPSPATDPQQLNFYSIVGLRTTSAGKETSSYAEAIPTAMAPGAVNNTSTPTGGIQTKNLQGGLKAKYVQSINGVTITNVAGFGFISSLAQYTSLGNIASGSQLVDLVPIGTPTAIPDPAEDPKFFADNIYQFATTAPLKNPDGGIIMCFDSGSTNQHAIISIGKGRSFTPRVEIKNGPSSLNGSGQCV